MAYQGEIFALTTSFLWSATAVIFSEASKLVGSHIVNVARLFLAVIFLTLTIFIFGLYKEVQLNYDQILFFSLSGFVGLSMGDTFLFKALELIGPRLSMLLMSMAPPLAALLSFFFLSERLSLLAWLGIFISTSGVAMVAFFDKHNNEKFNFSLYGLATGGLILAKKGLNSGIINEFVASFLRMISGFIFLLPLLAIAKKISFGKNFSLTSKAAILILVGSIVGPYLGITFSIFAINNSDVGIASTLMSLSPIILIPVSRLLYKDKITIYSVIGTFLAIIGVALIFLRDKF